MLPNTDIANLISKNSQVIQLHQANLVQTGHLKTVRVGLKMPQIREPDTTYG
nr:MAG TPA_asm: hypothetical protein [Bacteriophage sp.]